MIIFILILSFIAQLTCHVVEVKTSHGVLKGVKLKKSAHVTQFLGVPYALPPIKNLRFKRPEPLPDNYYGKGFAANKLAKACMQPERVAKFAGYDDWYPKKSDMSEDCLQFNMWVPEVNYKSVIVFFFGGQYTYGSPSIKFFNGSELAHHTNSIVLVVGYRLGVFGFAYYMGHKKFGINGNLGLLDQQLALKWVQNNIEYFDGDKKKVTIIGHGSGGAMATAHLYSIGSHKLFKRIIALSGTINNKWAVSKTRYVEKNFKQLIKKLNCTNSFWFYEIKCMQYVKASNIIKEVGFIDDKHQSFFSAPFIPVDMDKVFFKGNVKILFRRNVISKSKIDILFGRTSEEGSLFMPFFLDDSVYGCRLNLKKKMTDKTNQCNMDEKQFRQAVKLISTDYGLTKDARNRLLDVYSDPEEEPLRNKTIRIITDLYFHCSIDEFAEQFYKNVQGKKYIYTYKQRSTANPWPEWMGAMHGYDLLYIFGWPFRSPGYYNRKGMKREIMHTLNIMDVINGFVKNGSIEQNVKQMYKTINDIKGLGRKIVVKKVNRNYFLSETKCDTIKRIQYSYRVNDDSSSGQIYYD
ncbi:Acetylcholinesterase [Strongyloides ratti]|uniref:Acetylcholinesterase n=1 Tax=Strongyloides ratti TaxID=34506 RepID=A0A090MP27_STRRB|nr:Acetylcholinesterase [Strongyloides ratti]CEF59841.1 Acetylcholinesterase [Strongyloides ratti]